MMSAFGHTRIREWLLSSFTVKVLMNSHKPLLLRLAPQHAASSILE
ncbi:universal stress protein [Methylomonas sp. OY6]|uniref:Universal stress protein n=1 Tax=Methylomonas defluvii TaxID=3045149 RepID=A0ABU4UDC3_9GAMM|nr:universal stress protein [Methylomonas sp. OY6]MDX8127329.1 universal stress protein [Methylomonas sp. OY6]